jgi:penicillin amidase
MNLVLADTSGNIGYIMLLPSVNRKDKTPYIGSRVLDGTVSNYDWEGLYPLSVNPRSINPKRGFISTANNRQVPEHALYDAGSS